jgi:hypothetical protein
LKSGLEEDDFSSSRDLELSSRGPESEAIPLSNFAQVGIKNRELLSLCYYIKLFACRQLLKNTLWSSSDL